MLVCAACLPDLSGNALSSFPPHLPAFRFLRRLCLAGNRLSSLPPALAQQLPKLLHLDLAHNPSLGPALSPARLPPTLRWLSLEGCGLERFELDTALAPCAHPCMSSSPGALAGLPPQLLHLDLSANLFASTALLLACLLPPCPVPARLTHLLLAPNPCLAAAGPSSSSSFSPSDQDDMARLLRSLPCLRSLNGREYHPSLGSGSDALAQAMERATMGVPLGGGGGESCSCVEGNACAVPDNCRDWAHRFEVARRARAQGGGRLAREEAAADEARFVMQRDGLSGEVGHAYVSAGLRTMTTAP